MSGHRPATTPRTRRTITRVTEHTRIIEIHPGIAMHRAPDHQARHLGITQAMLTRQPQRARRLFPTHLSHRTPPIRRHPGDTTQPYTPTHPDTTHTATHHVLDCWAQRVGAREARALTP